jgi:ketosteroid isomerase-like protein
VTRKLFIVVVAVLAPLGSPIAAQQSTAEKELVQIERDWCSAGLKNDTMALGRILSDDVTAITNRGVMQTKSQMLADMKAQTSTFSACVDTNLKVRVYGDTAVVTGLASRSGTVNGVAFKDRQALWTDTFVKKDGRWQCVATQSTLVAPPQK